MPLVMQTMDQVAAEHMPANVIELHATGKLHKQDYRGLAQHLEQMLAVHGKLRMLVTVVDFHGWDVPGFWEELKMDVRHFNHFERIAVVGQTGGEHALADLFKPFTMAKLKYFDVDQLHEARQWIAERGD